MNVSNNNSDSSNAESKDDLFTLEGLVSIIGYNLTAYIGGGSSTQDAVDWLRNGLPAELESRMRAAFDVAKPIADVESELIAQGFLIQNNREMGSYRTPARMLREADAETVRSVLIRAAVAEFLSNEVSNLEEINDRLQQWIIQTELPKGVLYKSQLWQSRRLSLTLLHSNFPPEKLCEWDAGIGWPCWDQIIAAAPEMARARLNINLTTGCPFRYLRSRSVR